MTANDLAQAMDDSMKALRLILCLARKGGMAPEHAATLREEIVPHVIKGIAKIRKEGDKARKQ